VVGSCECGDEPSGSSATGLGNTALWGESSSDVTILYYCRKMPQGVKDIWQDLFHGQLTPHTMSYSSEVVSNGTWT
jgi:hypothetical protein